MLGDLFDSDPAPKPPVGRPPVPPIDKNPGAKTLTIKDAPVVKTVALFGYDVPLWPFVGGVLILAAVITARVRG